MDNTNISERPLTDEERVIVAARTAKYLTAGIEAYNNEFLKIDKADPNLYLEANAAINSLASLTLSLLSTLSGGKEKLCKNLTEYIDCLDRILLALEETPEDKYLATPEVDNSLPNETEAKWLARQIYNAHDVTCCDEGQVATQP